MSIRGWVREHPAVIVWGYRVRAIAWVFIGVWSFATGRQDSVALVWAASVYANSATDWGGAAAADDRTVMDALDAIRADNTALRGEVAALRGLLEQLVVNRPPEGDPTDD